MQFLFVDNQKIKTAVVLIIDVPQLKKKLIIRGQEIRKQHIIANISLEMTILAMKSRPLKYAAGQDIKRIQEWKADLTPSSVEINRYICQHKFFIFAT